MKLRLLAARSSATVRAATLLTTCGDAEKPASVPANTAATLPPTLHGQAAGVVDAVGALGHALRGATSCAFGRRGAIFTPAVVDEMGDGGETCEAYVEDLLANESTPRLPSSRSRSSRGSRSRGYARHAAREIVDLAHESLELVRRSADHQQLRVVVHQCLVGRLGCRSRPASVC